MNKTYASIKEVTDFGPFVRKLILPLPQAVPSAALSPDTFTVYVERRDRTTGDIIRIRKDWMSEERIESKGYCRIVDAYAANASGSRTDQGDFAVLELGGGLFEPLASEIATIDMHNVLLFLDMRITQNQPIKSDAGDITGLIYDRLSKTSLKQAEGWVNACSTNPEMPMRYGYFSPAMGSGKRPLIIWLHGAGEGGLDTAVAYIGNKVVSLSGDKNQDLFGGAYVLAPQVPTMWLDNGSGEYTRTGQSMYVESLKALIDEFIQLHSDIDTDRIYIGGCSNGGFMTMRMIIDYPGFFAAAYPVCEALYDEVISDQDIQTIKDTPIWFTHAKDDPIVKPEETVLPTFHRLIKAGAPNIHFSYFDNVKIKDADGNEQLFFGHATWLYMLNDECKLDFDGQPVKIDGQSVTLLQWMARQSR